MNLWYAFIVAGLTLTLDNIITLFSDRGNNSVTLTLKQRRITNIVRAVAGLVVIGFAWLTIANQWSQSDLKMTFTSVLEAMAFAFAVTGAFRFLSGVVILIAFTVLKFKTSDNQEINKCFWGSYMFFFGGLAIVIIDRNISPVLTPALFFAIPFVIFIALHYYFTRINRLK
jgi:hypothetical protein